MITPNNLSQRLICFLGIGGTSALVHIITVLNLVTYTHMQPLTANVFAFLLAFNVSFFGHKYLTFSQLDDQKELSLPHFFLVASTGGIINESIYFLLLEYTTINYAMALIFVLGLVSIYSYLLSRFWACR